MVFVLAALAGLGGVTYAAAKKAERESAALAASKVKPHPKDTVDGSLSERDKLRAMRGVRNRVRPIAGNSLVAMRGPAVRRPG